MKSLVLGIMIASVSMSFAQNDNQSTHQLKKQFKAKQKMKVEQVAVNVNDNSEPKEFNVLSRNDVESTVVSGIIRVKNGMPLIDVEHERCHRVMLPMNFTKAMMRDLEGKEIQFRYTLADHSSPKEGVYSMIVNLHDVAIVKRR